MTESRIPVQIYAAEHAVSERQVIKRITTGELSGYQTQGVWYVRIEVRQPEYIYKPTQPTPVLEYAQRAGIPASKILEEIASGSKQGFHAQGVWYVGTPLAKIPTAKFPLGNPMHWLLGILILAALAIGIVLWDWLNQQPKPQLASLKLEVQISDRVGKLHPVVQKTFFLISKSLEDIANDYLKDFATLPKPLQADMVRGIPKWLDLVTSSTALRSLLFDLSSRSNLLNIWEFRQNFEKSKALWMRYVTQSATTNRTGYAKFTAVIPGEYWLIGWTETRAGLGFWAYKMTVSPQENTLRLTPGNALYFR